MYKLLIILIFGTSANAIKLPGACPKVPPTHNIIHKTMMSVYVHILFTVPFSTETPTYLFNQVPVTEFYFEFFKKDKFKKDKFSLMSLRQLKVRQLHCSIIETKEEERIVLNSTFFEHRNDTTGLGGISLKPVPCLQPIQEEIHMWFDGDFAITWSCVDDLVAGVHEEGVVFAVNWKFDWRVKPNETEAFFSIIEEIKPIAGKYLSSQMMEAIDWKLEPHWLAEEDEFAWFPCPDEQTDGDQNTQDQLVN